MEPMNLEHSILKTIAFFDLFEFPLTAEEIKEHLYNYKKPLHIKELKGTLEEMENVEQIHDYYFLKGRGKLVDIRKTRKFIAEKFWNRTRQYGQYIARAPFVEMAAICNNLAYDNPNELSDIDLLIVIKEGRMWISRLWVTLVLHFFGVRRHHDKVVGRFCLSFFVTPKKLNMELLQMKPEDPYLGYWTKLVTPFYGEGMYKQFMEVNKGWLKEKYGLRFAELNEKKISFHGKPGLKRFWEWILGGKLGDFLELTLKKTFKKRTKQKAKKLGPEASIVISDDILKFHNRDRRKEFYEKWKDLTR